MTELFLLLLKAQIMTIFLHTQREGPSTHTNISLNHFMCQGWSKRRIIDKYVLLTCPEPNIKINYEVLAEREEASVDTIWYIIHFFVFYSSCLVFPFFFFLLASSSMGAGYRNGINSLYSGGM